MFSKSTRARGVIYQAPSSPYQYVKKKSWDAFWSHPQYKHSIAFFSNCSRSVTLTDLVQLKKEILGDLKNFKVTYKKKQWHNKEPAYYLKLVESKKATSSTKKLTMELFIFKKRTCFYVLNLLASANASGTDQARKVFQEFIKEFRVP